MLCLRAPVFWQGKLRKAKPAVPHIAARLLQRDLRTAEFFKRLVHAGVEVGKGVQHRSVQIEDDSFYHGHIFSGTPIPRSLSAFVSVMRVASVSARRKLRMFSSPALRMEQSK